MKSSAHTVVSGMSTSGTSHLLTGGLPSDMTGILYTVIRKIHAQGACTSSAASVQLKSRLPAFCDLNRAVTTALTGNARCCLPAQCLYDNSCQNMTQPRTAAERKRSSRENTGTRQHEQSVDTHRKKVRRQDATTR